MSEIKVKPLRWKGPDSSGEYHSLDGLWGYIVRAGNGNGFWLTEVGDYFASVFQAEAAAWADYESRILSALDTSSHAHLLEETRRQREEIAGLREALEAAKVEIVSAYRIWVADDINAWPKPHTRTGMVVAKIDQALSGSPVIARGEEKTTPVISDALRGEIAYALTKRLVIDMSTARASVDAATDYLSKMPAPAGNQIRATQWADEDAVPMTGQSPVGTASTNHAGPEGFFDDQFEEPRAQDSTLQAAAREAGWALSSLVDEIEFEKRQQVVNIINRLSAALAFNPARGMVDEELPYQCDACSTPGYGLDAQCHSVPLPTPNTGGE